MPEDDLLKRITRNPRVMVGQPCIRGTRLTVKYILNLLGHGETIEGILNEHSRLTQKDILACLSYASKALEQGGVWTSLRRTNGIETMSEQLRQVVIYPGEDGFWVAECPSLPGCISQGETRQEAIVNIREAIDLYLEVLEEDGLPVPEERFDVLVVAV